jgi:hypothetical protein
LSLLFVRRPDEKWEHTLALATENVAERVFEPVNASQFQVGHEDLAGIGNKLQALAEGLSAAQFRKMFRPDDSTWND